MIASDFYEEPAALEAVARRLRFERHDVLALHLADPAEEEFAFTEGIYSGYNAAKHSYDKSSWDYELGSDGYVKTDPTLAHPRCVYNLMKQHYARYVPEMVERVCGTPKDKVLHIWEMIASTASR